MDEILPFALIFYLIVLVLSQNIWESKCIFVGSVSIMAVKGFGVALKLTFGGNNQFTYPSTYIFGIIVTVCIVVQMNYFNKALDTFSTNMCAYRDFPLFFM